jgi:hypothetical protein
LLVQLFRAESRREVWTYLGFTVATFQDLGLQPEDSDRVVWQRCQAEQLVLITTNRNDEGPDSLESTIRTLVIPSSLPVITLADAKRLLFDRSYADRTADKLLEYLFDLDQYYGAGRLYVP